MINKLKNKIIFIYFGLLICQLPTSYSINNFNSYAKYRLSYKDGLPSQSILDMRIMSDNNIVVGTSGGLGIISKNGNNFISIIDSNLPVGGNPALEEVLIMNSANDEISIIATSGIDLIYYDEFGDEKKSGTGISWSSDAGQSWNFINQPVDNIPDCNNLGCEDPLDPNNCECYPALTGCSWNPTDGCYFANLGNILFEWNNTALFAFPVTTEAENITYDLSIDTENQFIYAASWGGVLRRFKYTESNPTWEHVALPTDNMPSMECGETATYPQSYVYDPRDPGNGGQMNHKPFSVYADTYNGETYIWAGTGLGVNRGILQNDGCIAWDKYTIDDGLAGDWVIDIVPQYIDGNDIPRIWLISWDTETLKPDNPGPHSLTYSDDNGETWNAIHQFSEQYDDVNGNEIYDLEDEFTDCDTNNLNICEDSWQWSDSMGNGIYDGATVYNLYFNDDIYYAATNRGLYWSEEDNINIWTKVDIPDFILEELNYIENIDEGIFFSETVFSCIARDQDFFIGTPNGLIIVSNVDNLNVPVNENSWSAYIASEQSILDENRLNIFPNPFKVGRTSSTSFVTFEYKSDTDGEITIFDFSMNEVDSFDCKEDNYISENIKCTWDGYNSNRIKVANGVYFCRIKTRDSEAWGKLMVINLSGGDYE